MFRQKKDQELVDNQELTLQALHRAGELAKRVQDELMNLTQLLEEEEKKNNA